MCGRAKIIRLRSSAFRGSCVSPAYAAAGFDKDAAAVETAAVLMKLLRVNISISFSGTGTMIAYHVMKTLRCRNGHIPVQGNHLAGFRQVGGGDSLTLDAIF